MIAGWKRPARMQGVAVRTVIAGPSAVWGTHAAERQRCVAVDHDI
ncbi:hypothetical protein ZBT109_0695 [Zymobacter palmae]|uniref:Uncharacterized protein n=1 Tax=Zymobacter palmae TaxID=33074 RepID=A0A348HCW9_9GAMM|nr:hypothetical protein ZBT109_0695 [Zymobacter palmae]